MKKLVKESLNEFGKGKDPKTTLGLGVDTLLKQEDEKHDWAYDINRYFPDHIIFDIINYYGNYYKVIKLGFDNINIEKYCIIQQDSSYSAKTWPSIYESAYEGLTSEINHRKISNELYSIAGRIDVSKLPKI